MKSSFSKLKSHLIAKNSNKLVYRFVSEREKKAIENNDLSQIGIIWHDKNAGNTHKYKEGTKYIHLLDNIKDSITLYREFGKNKQYFCTYSIPKRILKKYAGKGFYIPVGYETFNTVKEYAIPIEEFDINWLVSTTPINEFLQDTNIVK